MRSYSFLVKCILFFIVCSCSYCSKFFTFQFQIFLCNISCKIVNNTRKIKMFSLLVIKIRPTTVLFLCMFYFSKTMLLCVVLFIKIIMDSRHFIGLKHKLIQTILHLNNILSTNMINISDVTYPIHLF